MQAEKIKEELLNQIYNRMAWNSDPEVMEAATRNVALYVLDLMLFERQILSEASGIEDKSIWEEVKKLLI